MSVIQIPSEGNFFGGGHEDRPTTFNRLIDCAVPEDLNIELDGCESEEGLEAFVKGLVERIQQSAPADSFIKVHLEKTPLGTRGWMKISSLAGVFWSEARGLVPWEVAKRMTRDMKKEISLWHKRRVLQTQLT